MREKDEMRLHNPKMTSELTCPLQKPQNSANFSQKK